MSYTVADAIRILRVSRPVVYRLIQTGEIQAKKRGVAEIQAKKRGVAWRIDKLPVPDRAVTTKDISVSYGVPAHRIRKMIRAGRIVATRIGRKWIITRAEAISLLVHPDFIGNR